MITVSYRAWFFYLNVPVGIEIANLYINTIKLKKIRNV